MTKLSVNLNAVAYLRNRRDVGWPDLLEVAEVVMKSGANGITVHPRPDERHIRRADIYTLSSWLRQEYPDAEFNIEGYPNEAFLALVSDVKPAQVTLVPDDPDQVTSDHGWDLSTQGDALRPVIASIQSSGSRVSLFIDPDPENASLALPTGTDRVEIYTGSYGAATNSSMIEQQLTRIRQTADAVGRLGINAGHDLTASNLPALVQLLPELAEVSIGHGITSDALINGFAKATAKYLAALVCPDTA